MSKTEMRVPRIFATYPAKPHREGERDGSAASRAGRKEAGSRREQYRKCAEAGEGVPPTESEIRPV